MCNVFTDLYILLKPLLGGLGSECFCGECTQSPTSNMHSHSKSCKYEQELENLVHNYE